MSKAIAPYLKKRAVHHAWPLQAPTAAHLRSVVVIPVLAESARLFDTLGDLAANHPVALAQSLILCVVNNRAPEMAAKGDCDDNQRTLAQLPEFAADHPQMHLAWIDAASPGHTLGPKEGVGLARKIGLDTGLQLLHEQGRDQAPLVCLDADTRVTPDYLENIHDFFAEGPRWAAVVDYAHPVAGDDDETRAILAYEFFLRYQELALHYAGSPYHYPAIGSTMMCTGAAYAAAGGMNRRQAGEDFYFLQQLAKTGHVDRIWDTTVYPASRPSHRVPFGTGRKVGAYEHAPDDAFLIYHPATYDVIRNWLAMAQEHLDEDGATLLKGATEIDGELGVFLEDQDFATAWDRIQQQSTTAARRQRNFHEWFDAFRTLKLTHHLRDNGYPRQDLFEALGAIAGHHGLELPARMGPPLRDDLDGQRAVLKTLRAWRPVG